MAQLGLPAISRQPVRYADGRTEFVDMIGPLMVQIQGRHTHDDAFVLGDEILIGQTALESMDLHVDCYNQRLIPNPRSPDRPAFRI